MAKRIRKSQLALGGQTVKNCFDLRMNLSSTKVNASGWSNEVQVERKSKACVDLRLARALEKKCRVNYYKVKTVCDST